MHINHAGIYESTIPEWDFAAFGYTYTNQLFISI